MQALMRRGYIYVSLSMDGPPELHDLQRPNAGGKGAGTAVAKAIPIVARAIQDKSEVALRLELGRNGARRKLLEIRREKNWDALQNRYFYGYFG